ncbi:MAG: ABC transporter substrate-binding protein [Rhodobacteraceae bacterium]|nr:ABC transporter substrate-binding protein [Paracoccaceae bacterium]
MLLGRLLVPAAAALAVAAGAVAATGTAAQELRIGYSADVPTLDPGNHRNRFAEGVILNIHDALVARTDDMAVVDELIEGWTQIDALTYEARLRRGVRFHSGDEMTAEDVKFTFDRLTKEGFMGGQTSPRKSLLGPLADTEIVDPHTVRFHLSAPWPILRAYLPFQQIVSKRFVEATGTEGMATHTNGTGPFRLVEWRRGEAIILERFDDYYGGAPDLPPVGPAGVERVIFRIIPESASRVAALLAGEVDIIDNLPVTDIPVVEANPATRVMTTNGTRSFFVDLNNAVPPFNDVRVRQAANMAIDRDLIVERVLGGLAVPLNGLISPQSYGYNADLPPWSYDPDRVRALLGEAGFPDGVDVTLDVDPANRENAEAVAAMLTQNGIRTTVQVWELNVMDATWREENAAGRNMRYRSWGDGALDPVGIFDPVLRTGGRGNFSRYSNAEVDALLAAAESETDVARRSRMYQDAQAIVREEAPLLFLWLPRDIYGVSARLSGWRPSPRGVIKIHDARVD